MLSLDGTQQAIVDATVKQEISWLFEVDKDGNGVVNYYWSTKAKTWASQPYIFKIIDFPGIEMVRSQSESGIQAPSEFEFTVSNKDNALSPSDFAGGNVTLRLVIAAGVNEAEIRVWNFDIEGVQPGPHTLLFRCRDWLQKYLQGDYPNTQLISHLFPQEDTVTGGFCVPLIFGKPCIPVAPIVYNLVPNGYMELDSNWADWGEGPYINERSDTHVKEGDYSRKLTVYGGAQERGGIKSDTFTTENGRTYIVDFWAYIDQCLIPYIAVRKGNDSGWLLYDYHGHWPITTCANYQDRWTHFRFSFTEGAATGGSGAYIVFYGWMGDTARTAWIDQVFVGKSFYLLGEKITNPTDYDVDEIQTPRDWEGDHQIWLDTDFTFSYSHVTAADGNDYAVAEFIVDDCDSDGTADANILFKSGNKYLPVGAWYTRSDTSSKTSPADILDYILKDWGIPATKIDATTLAAVKSTFSGWGLTWNMGLWQKEARKKLLARLLIMCHTELIVRDKIYFKVHSKTSQKTLAKAQILKTADRAASSFDYDIDVSADIKDSGYITYQEERKCLDSLLKVLVSAKGSADNISDEEIRADYIQDSQNAQRVGILALQRRFLAFAKAVYSTKGTCLALEPDDVVTINHADYGGTYAVLIDRIFLTKGCTLDIEASRFSQALDDWGDLSPSAVDITLIPDSDSYKVVTSGPDALTGGGTRYIGNVLPGRLRVGETGNYILLDPVQPIVEFVEGGVTRLKIGDLGTEDYGVEILDHAGNSIMKLDGSGNNILCGGLILDGTNKRIESDNYVSGVAGAGFRLDPDILEVGNIACRGIFRTAVFQKDVVSAIGGNLIVLPADVLATDMTAADSSTLTIEGNETFAVNDLLRIKDGTDDEWLEVTNTGSAPTYTVTRDKGADYGANANPAWKKGATVVNYGQSGDGFVYMTASETNAPYMSVVTHAGSPWDTLTTKVRLGNLNGYAGYSSDIYGLALYEDADNYLKFDPTNGIQIAVSATDAITLKAGGDILLTPSDTDPSLVKWGSSVYLGMASTEARGLCLWPDTAGTQYFRVGYDPINNQDHRFNYITLSAKLDVVFYTNYDTDNNSTLELWSGNDLGHLRLYIETAGVSQYYYWKPEQVYASAHKQSDLGLEDHAWDDVWGDDFQNVADLYHLDQYDDLAALIGIQKGVEIDPRNTLPLIDDSTIPEWMLSRSKDGKKILRDPEGKPWLSNKVLFSTIIGALRELDAKIKALK